MNAAQLRRMRDNRESRWDAEKQDAGGEGSRGGKIIGRTKSGKPVYGSHSSHVGFANDQNHLNAEEHGEAAKLHGKLADKSTGEKAKHHRVQQEAHNISSRQERNLVSHLGR